MNNTIKMDARTPEWKETAGNISTRRQDAKGPALCDALVYRRDTYRYTGGGSSGFEMNYERGQCERHASDGPFCWQHARRLTPPRRWSELWKRSVS